MRLKWLIIKAKLSDYVGLNPFTTDPVKALHFVILV